MKNAGLALLVLLMTGACHQNNNPSSPAAPVASTTSSGHSTADTVVIPDVNPAGNGPTKDWEETPETSTTAEATNVLDATAAQLGQQKKIVILEKAAYQKALEERNSTVHIGKDLYLALVNGVGSGVLTYRFLRDTDLTNRTRKFFSEVPTLAPPAQPVASPAETAAVTAEKEAVLKGAARRAQFYRGLGSNAWKTTELVSAVTFAALAAGYATQTWDGINILTTDTQEMREHYAKLVDAEKNVEAAEESIKAAAVLKPL